MDPIETIRAYLRAHDERAEYRDPFDRALAGEVIHEEDFEQHERREAELDDAVREARDRLRAVLSEAGGHIPPDMDGTEIIAYDGDVLGPYLNRDDVCKAIELVVAECETPDHARFVRENNRTTIEHIMKHGRKKERSVPNRPPEADWMASAMNRLNVLAGDGDRADPTANGVVPGQPERVTAQAGEGGR